MIEATIFLDGNYHSTATMEEPPRLWETVRLANRCHAIVTEVIWCLDELTYTNQKVYIRAETFVKAKGEL